MKRIGILTKAEEIPPFLKGMGRKYRVKTFDDIPACGSGLEDTDLFFIHLDTEYNDEIKTLSHSLSDLGTPFIIYSEIETLKNAALAMKNGAADYFTRSADNEAIVSRIDFMLMEHEL
ncbi:hypothetical protein ACFLU6_16630, partial [Acidobacteriota bacterium]